MEDFFGETYRPFITWRPPLIWFMSIYCFMISDSESSYQRVMSDMELNLYPAIATN